MLQEENRRWNKRKDKEAFQRSFLRLQKEDNELRQQARGLGFIQLDPPRRHGWEKFFVLREDIKRRNDANIIQNLLNKISKSVTSKKRDFKHYSYEQNRIIVLNPELTPMLQKDFNKLSEQEKKYFYPCYSYKYNEIRYKFLNDYFFITKVKPYYLTQIKIFDREIVSREKEIENRFQIYQGWRILHKFLGQKSYRSEWNCRSYDIELRCLKKIVKEELNEYFYIKEGKTYESLSNC